MANSKGPSTVRSMMFNGKNSLLPPKSPLPSISPAYTEYISSSTVFPKVLPKPRDGNSHHQHTSSESFLIEEQPSWLDELLNEPEMPVRRGGHRRSSSDSVAYIDSVNTRSLNDLAQDDNNKFNNMTPVPMWGSQDFNIYKELQQSSYYSNSNSIKTRNNTWDATVGSMGPMYGLPSPRDDTVVPNARSLSDLQDSDRNLSSTEKKDSIESVPQDLKSSIYKKDYSHAKSSEMDTKRAKQQFAQRSRVRKLQYIAELERNVQALQAEGTEVSAEFEFLNQQNLILSMENKAMKQRLESLAQEQLIKYLEHEVLEKEVGRLRSLYQQQQQQPQQQKQQPLSSSHRRANSRDLDQQFASLSLKHKETSTGRDSVSSQLHNVGLS